MTSTYRQLGLTCGLTKSAGIWGTAGKLLGKGVNLGFMGLSGYGAYQGGKDVYHGLRQAVHDKDNRAAGLKRALGGGIMAALNLAYLGRSSLSRNIVNKLGIGQGAAKARQAVEAANKARATMKQDILSTRRARSIQNRMKTRQAYTPKWGQRHYNQPAGSRYQAPKTTFGQKMTNFGLDAGTLAADMALFSVADKLRGQQPQMHPQVAAPVIPHYYPNTPEYYDIDFGQGANYAV